jgi:sulfate/thiosulfate transport system ATP-binding protein
MISVTGVTKRFGDFTALDDVSLEVPEGSLSALLGPSGSGKSTLLRIIAGLDVGDSGKVLIDGVDQALVPARKRQIGFVFQHYAAFKHMSVRENVAFGLKIRKRPKQEIAKRVDELLGIVGLTGYQDRYPSQLSGGQRQRMALARALAVEPRLLLLDEPFGALDANVRSDLRTWLRKLHEEVPVTTVIVTHDQEEAMEISDRIAVMSHGKIEQVGTPRDLYERPQSDFVMGFLGPVTELGGRLVRPHDLHITTDARGGALEAMVGRITHLGFEVRVDLVLVDGSALAAQVTRGEAEALELREGDVVWVGPDRSPSAGATVSA